MRHLVMQNYDFVIVGGGVIGLTIARALQKRKLGSVAVFEKESGLGEHASGRNSGVVHAGLYYPPGSLKAKLCVAGAKRLSEFAIENSISYQKNGKVIVAKNATEQEEMKSLFERAKKNGVNVERVCQQELREIEPVAKTFEWAIHSPDTGLIAPKEVLNRLASLIKKDGGTVLFSEKISAIHSKDKTIQCSSQKVGYGVLINCAGMFADQIAHLLGVGLKYQILPFKGLYRELLGPVTKACKKSIYPMPNLKVPFLGIHVTPQLNGKVLLGPTAQPVLGRENYHGLQGARWRDCTSILKSLAPMVLSNRGKMRSLAVEEFGRKSRRGVWAEVRQMAPDIQEEEITGFCKVGLRAQLLDTETGELEMDFVVEKGENSVHILNAVSPGMTASFAFADYVVSGFS